MAVDPSLEAALQAAHTLQTGGRLVEAEAAYRHLLANVVDEPVLHDNLGVVLAMQGRFGDAIPAFQQALSLNPDLSSARHNLIRAWMASGDLKSAADACESYLRQDPDNRHALALAGDIAQRLNRPDDALKAYGRVLAVVPGHFGALLGRANVLRASGQLAEAAEAFKAARASDPTRPEPMHGYARVLAQLGQTGDAVALWRTLIDKRPRYVPSWVSLFEAAWADGQPEVARAVLVTARHRQPGVAALHGALGDACVKLGSHADAAGCYREAMRHSDDLVWLRRLVEALGRLGKFRDAIEVLQAQLATRADVREIHASLGRAYALAGDAESARRHFGEARSLGWHDGVGVNAAIVLPAMLASVEQMQQVRVRQLDEFRQLAQSGLTLADPLAQVGLTNFYLAYHGEDDRPWQEALADLYRRAAPSLAYTARHCQPGAPPRTPGPIRVGFVSSFLCGHTISRLNSGLIEHLDRDRFHVTVIPLGERDAETARLAGLADAACYPDTAMAASREQIAALELDVLIYTDIGMEATTYFLAYARLAPVQIVTWGHPVTTGIPTVDYFLSDASLEPAGAQDHYTERLINLGTMPCYYLPPMVPDDPASDRERLGFAADDHLYVCPQTLFKLHPAFDAYLVGILDSDPQARLVFIAGPEEATWQQLLCERLAAVSPNAPERLVFVGKCSRMDYLRLLRTADVLLDPIHFGSGNSAYEAVAVGTPVITQPGAFMRGRVMLGCYHAIGVPDCVVADQAAYVAAAVAIAGDPGRRQALSARILANRDRLFCNLQAVRRLEAFMADAVAGKDLSQCGWAFPPPSQQ